LQKTLKTTNTGLKYVCFFAFLKNNEIFEEVNVKIRVLRHECLEWLGLKPNPKIKNVSRIRKKTFYLKFCMETPEGHQKSIFSTLKMKKNKDTYGIYPTKFASSTQKHKKVIETPKNKPIEIK
jgi:hypothetical protein